MMATPRPVSIRLWVLPRLAVLTTDILVSPVLDMLPRSTWTPYITDRLGLVKSMVVMLLLPTLVRLIAAEVLDRRVTLCRLIALLISPQDANAVACLLFDTPATFIRVAVRLGMVTVEMSTGIEVPIKVKLVRLLLLLPATPVVMDIGLSVSTASLAVDPGIEFRLTIEM